MFVRARLAERRKIEILEFQKETGTNACTYCSLWGVTIQNLFVWRFLNLYNAGKGIVFSRLGSMSRADIKV